MAVKVVVNINELLYKHDISIRELSRLTNIRHAALSELSSHKRKSMSFSHIERIADALEIKDIREIITIQEVQE